MSLQNLLSYDLIQEYIDVPLEQFKYSAIEELIHYGYSQPVLNQNFADLLDKSLFDYANLLTKYRPNSSNSSFKWSDLNESCYLKYAIGSKNGLGESYAQLLQSLYLPNRLEFLIDNTCPIYKVTLLLILIRNFLCELNPCFGFNPTSEGFWNSSRVHHYPSGGGFMMSHKDTAFPKALEKSKIKFLQVSASLSIKNWTYFEGGGFVISKDGRKIYTDRTNSNKSTITLFDGSITHGVEDVDKSNLLSFSPEAGRLAIFAGLYPYID